MMIIIKRSLLLFKNKYIKIIVFIVNILLIPSSIAYCLGEISKYKKLEILNTEKVNLINIKKTINNLHIKYYILTTTTHHSYKRLYTFQIGKREK